MNILKRKPMTQEMKPFDVSMLEDQVKEEIMSSRKIPALEYSGQEGEVEMEKKRIEPELDVSKITAEAIATSHEAAAQALAQLGTELVEHINQIDKMKIEADLALKDCLETAQYYRDKGKTSSEKVSATMKLVADIRETCKALRERIG